MPDAQNAPASPADSKVPATIDVGAIAVPAGGPHS